MKGERRERQDATRIQTAENAIVTMEKYLDNLKSINQAWDELPDEDKRGKEKPVLPMLPSHILALRRLIDACKGWLKFEHALESDKKARGLLTEIDRIADQTDSVDSKVWVILKLLAAKYFAMPPKHITYDISGSPVSFTCPSCKGLTITNWGTEYYHCSKCGQKIRTYNEQGIWGVGHENH